jgi:16S rRNA (guanine527-N7)-methyltransferase
VVDLSQSPQLPELPDLWQQTLNWTPSLTQQELYQQLYEAILQGNRQLNLTRIIEPREFWEKHLWDSLRGIKPWLESPLEPLNLIDIGTGAGFPGLPIAIACPAWQMTLLDSTHKKIAFIETLLNSIGISAHTLVDRAEQIGQLPQHREQYDLALIRAVATASVCAEYTLPLLKLGGTAILYRGQWLDQEAASLEAAVQPLGGVVDQVESFTTPFSQSVRHCIYLKKIQPTPARFPRAVGVPTQKPL